MGTKEIKVKIELRMTDTLVRLGLMDDSSLERNFLYNLSTLHEMQRRIKMQEKWL